MIEVKWEPIEGGKSGYAHFSAEGKRVGWLKLEGPTAFNFLEHIIRNAYKQGEFDALEAQKYV